MFTLGALAKSPAATCWAGDNPIEMIWYKYKNSIRSKNIAIRPLEPSVVPQRSTSDHLSLLQQR